MNRTTRTLSGLLLAVAVVVGLAPAANADRPGHVKCRPGPGGTVLCGDRPHPIYKCERRPGGVIRCVPILIVTPPTAPPKVTRGHAR